MKISKKAKNKDKIVGYFYVHAMFSDGNLKVPGISETRNTEAYFLLLEELEYVCNAHL